jgi:hypothetical protein
LSYQTVFEKFLSLQMVARQKSYHIMDSSCQGTVFTRGDEP